MKRWLRLACLPIAILPCHAQTPCRSGALAQLAANAHRINAALLSYKLDEMQTSVAKPAQERIARFKDALVAVVYESVRCGPAMESAASLETRLARLLQANQPQKPDRSGGPSEVPIAGMIGSDLSVKVSTPANASNLLAIVLTFGTQCGDDSILLLYKATPDGMHRLLRWQSPPYNEASGAFGDFFVFGILPATASNGLRVAVAHGHPWCTSRFSGFDIDLLAPGADPNTPRVVWHTERGYSRGDAVSRMKATADTFELRLNTAAMDINTFEVPVVYRYRVTGDQVKRIEPIATNGRGFVEEWLEMPWDEAKDQVSAESVAAAKRIHDQFAAPVNANDKSFLNHTDGPVRACRDETREFQVEIGNTRETFVEGVPGGRTETLPSTYFHLRETGDGYELEAVGNAPDPNCNGSDLMPRKPQ
jgi:hypothetical protein